MISQLGDTEKNCSILLVIMCMTMTYLIDSGTACARCAISLPMASSNDARSADVLQCSDIAANRCIGVIGNRSSESLSSIDDNVASI